MQIPIASIYYLLCYAWDHLQELTAVDADFWMGLQTDWELWHAALPGGQGDRED